MHMFMLFWTESNSRKYKISCKIIIKLLKYIRKCFNSININIYPLNIYEYNLKVSEIRQFL